MNQPAPRRAPKHLKRKLSASDGESTRGIIVLVIALVVVVIMALFFLTISDEPSVLEVDHEAGRGEAEVLAQLHAFRPVEGVLANYQRFYASEDEVLGSKQIDERNLANKDQFSGSSSISGQDFARLKLQTNELGPNATPEEIEAHEKAREALADWVKPYDPWPNDADGVDRPDETPRESFARKTLKSKEEIRFAPSLMLRLDALGKLKHGRVVKVNPVEADTFDLPSPNLNLMRELKRGNYTRLKNLDGKEYGEKDFIRPIQQETPWQAMDDLIGKVAEAGQAKIDAASNGDFPFEGQHPEVVLQQRGHVFELKGRLFMLRKQQLRDTAYIQRDGSVQKYVYFGIVAYTRKAVGGSFLEHHATAFSAIDIPDDLKAYALEANEFCSNDDKLANEEVHVALNGVYFRRFCFSEPVAEISVDSDSKPEGEGKEMKVAEYYTEAYMPWLIAPSMSQIEVTKLDLDEIKDAVDQVHSRHPVNEGQRQKFDEAGYYLCLQALNRDGNALSDLPAHELVIRMLREEGEAKVYRGTHAKAAGILRATYHTLVLKPNISGKRHVYRAFVTDALDAKEVDALQQWYVDLLEPPVRFRGEPRVMIDGFYYRSQLFNTLYNGSRVDALVPLLIARKLEHYRPQEFESLHQRADEEDDGSAIWIAIGGVIIVIGVVLFLYLQDRKSRAGLDDETMAHVRGRLAEARRRNRIDRHKRDEAEGKVASAENASDAADVKSESADKDQGDADSKEDPKDEK